MPIPRALARERSPDSGRTDTASTGERGVSPVIGVALMIAITVTLVVIVAPVIFTVSGSAGDSTPNADWGFSYDEAVDPERSDSFGNTSSDVGASGMMTLVLESGEDIEAGTLEIAGTASGGNLAEASAYEADEPVIPGEEIHVWVNRGDDVQLIWNDPNAGESSVLAEFSVRPTGELPVFVPEPDEGCDYIEGQLGDNNLNIDGVVVSCDLSQYTINDIDIVNGGGVIGDVPVNGDVDLDDGTVYIGDVTAGGDVNMDNGAEVDGDVVARGGSNPDLDVQNSKIRGSVSVGGDLYVVSSTISGPADADGTVDLNNAVVEGKASAGESVLLKDESLVMDDASAPLNVSLDDASEIRGDPILPDIGNDLKCNDGDNSLVAGVGCEEYKEPRYTITVDETNEPLEGDTLKVNVTVENVGYDSGNPDAYLYVDGAERHNWNPTIDGESSKEQTLTWDTSDGDAGSYDAVVEVDNQDGTLHDSDTEEVLVADDSRSQDGLLYEVDGTDNLEIRIGDTVPYTATASYDDGSTEDVTDEVDVNVTAGDDSDVTIDESNNEVTGDNDGTVTLEADDANGFTDTVDLTVSPPMADQVTATGTSFGTFVEFDLENTGSYTVEIEEISVDNVITSSGNADKIDNDGNNEVNQQGDWGYLDTQKIEIGGAARSFDNTTTIDPSEVSSFRMGEVRQGNGKSRSATEVMFTLYFSDGTSRQYTIN